MTVSQPDTTNLYGRVASLLGRKVSRPDARKAGIAISTRSWRSVISIVRRSFGSWDRRKMASMPATSRRFMPAAMWWAISAA